MREVPITKHMAAANKTGSNMTNAAGKPLCAERTARAIKATSEAVSKPNLVER